MPKAGIFAIAAVAVLTLLSLVYFALTFESSESTTTVILEPPVRRVEEAQIVEAPTSSRQNNSPLPQIRIEPQAPTPTVAIVEPEIAPPPEEVQIPVQQALPTPEQENSVVELPSLTESDSFVFNALGSFQSGATLVGLLAEDQIVRKFVVFVENISRGEFPQTGLPAR